MKKKILIICGVLLAMVVTVAGTFKYYVRPKYVTPLVRAVEEFLLEDEEGLDLLIQEYEKSLTEDEKLAYEIEKIKQDQIKAQEIAGTGETVDETNQSSDDQNVENLAKKLKKPDKKTNSKVVAGGKTMEELQQEVAPNDLKAGLNIASKINTGHLLSLSKGGLTPEDKKAAKAHLQDRLTSSEYSQLKGLVGKYAYLLK